MSLFDFLKNIGNGEISNAAYQRQRQKEIDRLERKYDLSTVEGIDAIPVPKRKAVFSDESVTGKIEYYLMIKGGTYEKAGESELALACYRKANQLMPMSSTAYPYDTYMRLPRYLRKLRRFDEARAEEAKVAQLFAADRSITKSLGDQHRAQQKAMIKSTMREGSDLVEVSWISGCCEICGKYRGRIFSMTGRDKRFPRFPADFCEKCGLTYFPFLFGVNSPQYSKKSGKALISEMNRPFTDTRTAQDKRNYQLMLNEFSAEKDRDASRADYDWLWEFIPDICPKSFSGYMRMKNSNSDNFKKIVAEAKKRGRTIK